jgi:hypothetical protein
MLAQRLVVCHVLPSFCGPLRLQRRLLLRPIALDVTRS